MYKEYKPVEGVTFVEYDIYGYAKTKLSEKDDFRQFLANEDDNLGFESIAAPPE